MKPRILILDTYYPDVIRSMPINPAGTYESELQAILQQSFGTFDAYSRNLRALGWDAYDLIINHEDLMSLFYHSYNGMAAYYYDVIFLQNLAIDWKKYSAHPHRSTVVAGQLSCPWPGDANVRKCDIIFTSFPHYVARIEALGVKAVYVPLAFDPIIFKRLQDDYPDMDDCVDENGISRPERIYDCTFVGGVGNPGHWRKGMEVLNAVAEAIPTFKWWGYGAEHLPIDSALFQKYQGEAWGLDMYRIFCQSKIVLNRHGEVAEGYSNNMRMFEATGCGALLLTDAATNLSDFFIESNGVNDNPEIVAYHSAEDAVDMIDHLLNSDFSSEIAANGQQRTLRDHTYAHRMKTVSDTLMEMLCKSPQTTAR